MRMRGRNDPPETGDQTVHAAHSLILQSDGEYGTPPAVIELPTVGDVDTAGAT